MYVITLREKLEAQKWAKSAATGNLLLFRLLFDQFIWNKVQIFYKAFSFYIKQKKNIYIYIFFDRLTLFE